MALPTISVLDSAVAGEAGGVSVFTIKLSASQTRPVSVDYTTVSGTATAGVDFIPVSGTVTFAAGQTSKQVAVNIINDTEVEADESFTLKLSNAILSLAFADDTGAAVITSDDVNNPPPPPPPPPGGLPNASNTGYTGTLTNSGSINSSANGQIIEGKNVTGQIIVNHTGVIIRNCQVNGPGNDVAIFITKDDCTVEDCTIPAGNTPGARGIWVEGNTSADANRAMIRRCNISRFEDGVVLGTGSHHTVRDNWFHGAIPISPGDPHIDGIQLHGGQGNFSLIENNNVDLYDNVSSSMTMGARNVGEGAVGVTINGNRLYGGTANLYVEGSDSSGVTVTNNRFGIFADHGSHVSGTGLAGCTFSGNVDDATGNPITLP